MIPRLKAHLKIKDLLAIWPRGNKFNDILRFEQEFAKLAGQSHAIFFPYGRTAQLAILNALKLIEKGKTEVILPSYSCVVVAHAIKKAGLTPVFIVMSVVITICDLIYSRRQLVKKRVQ
ncbi:MAG: hypothetical protein C0582_01585 [Alphaproteobacteria bacterium]|nr:MAG: hypothetical protein C0582_01585 [Alphaproteobacteria bacterium]